jgi:HAD superfamily hydrolase (TIGR01509 family)
VPSALNFKEFSAVTFDFDGTLANTVATHNKARLLAFDQMAEETGDERFRQVTPEIQAEAHRHGSNPLAIIGWALQAAGIVKDIADPLAVRTAQLKKEAYLELCLEGLEPIPHALDFMRSLSKQFPKKIGITTTAHRVEVMAFVEKHGLHDILPKRNIVTYEDVGPDRMKPDPLAYQISLKRFGLPETPERMLVFEDTPGGLMAATAAGATAVAMCTSHSKDELQNAPYDYIFAGFDRALSASK